MRGFTVLASAATLAIALSLGTGPDAASKAKTFRCSLTDEQMRKGAKAFRELVPVFHHPRCANCHGVFDVFAQSGDELHEGGRIETKKQKPEPKDTPQDFGLGTPASPAPAAEFEFVRDDGLCAQCHKPTNAHPE